MLSKRPSVIARAFQIDELYPDAENDTVVEYSQQAFELVTNMAKQLGNSNNAGIGMIVDYGDNRTTEASMKKGTLRVSTTEAVRIKCN